MPSREAGSYSVGSTGSVCSVVIGATGLSSERKHELGDILRSDPRVARVRFFSRGAVLRRLGISAKLATGIAIPARFVFTIHSIVELPGIAARLRAFGRLIPTPGCAILRIPAMSNRFTLSRVESVFAAKGVRLSLARNPGLAAGPTPSANELVLETWEEIDQTAVLNVPGAAYLAPADNKFHVLVFPGTQWRALRTYAGNPRAFDIARGNVFVRDIGMTKATRQKVLRAVRSL